MPDSHSNSSSQVAEWVGSKAQVLVLNRVDMILPQAQQLWVKWFKAQREEPFLPMPKMVKVWQLWHRRRLELG